MSTRADWDDAWAITNRLSLTNPYPDAEALELGYGERHCAHHMQIINECTRFKT